MSAYKIIDGKYHHAAPHRANQARRHRSYAAAKIDRLSASFTGSSLSPDEALRRDLRMLRKRSRQLCMDNDYARRFLKILEANVVGVNGIKLQARTTWPDGQPDERDNDTIEQAWADWGKPENCATNGRLSWHDVQRLFISTVARDGEVLLRHVTGADLTFGYQVQLIEADHLDENYNRILRNGHRIVMGIEVDRFDRPVSYHLFTRHPGDNAYLWGGKHYEVVPADDIVHAFICERPGQNRGVPWMHTAIKRLHMLGDYEIAELTAAQVGASKMGFFGSPEGDSWSGDDVEGAAGDGYGPHDDAPIIDQVEPGTFHQLPDGTTFTPFDPQHPTAAFADFAKAVLRGASSGLNVSYPTLGNNLEGVNFSSIRQGELADRDHWRVLQGWLIDQLHRPVYANWLRWALLTQALPLPASKIAKYRAVVWQPRGWDWVDPLKDIKASEAGVALGVTTRAEIAASKGRDLREIFAQLKAEQDMASEYGINISAPAGAPKMEAQPDDE